MFRIQSKKDVRMIGRAIREDWDYDRKEVVAALMEVVINRDPDLMLEAIDRLQRGDEIQIKRELAELKKTGDENAIRLRLFEIARHIDADELAKLASKNGVDDTAINARK